MAVLNTVLGVLGMSVTAADAYLAYTDAEAQRRAAFRRALLIAGAVALTGYAIVKAR
jgi:hypothetical protein